jgi:superfamily II DNA or RNA helicase
MLEIYLNKGIVICNAPYKLESAIKDILTIDNPEYIKRKERKMPTWGIPKRVSFYAMNKGNLHIGIGNIDKLCSLLENMNITGFRFIDERVSIKDKKLFESKIVLRSYQVGNIEKLLEHENGVLESPAGSGKTVVGLALMEKLQQHTLWLTHTKELMLQTRDKANKFFTEIGEVGLLYGDAKFIGKGNLIIASVRTLIMNDSLLEKLSRFIGCVIVDEAHHTPANTFIEVITRMNSKYVYGLTATPYRPDGLQVLMEAAIGPIRDSVPRSLLYEKGYLIKPEIKPVYTDFNFSQAANTKKVINKNAYSVSAGGETFTYHELLSAIYEDNSRLYLICDNIANNIKNENYQLVLCNNKAYLTRIKVGLDSILKTRNIQEEVIIINSDFSSKERAKIMKDLNNRKIKIILATQLAKEGLDIEHLNILHLATPRKGDEWSKGGDKKGNSLEQEVGRVMRPDPQNPNKKSIVFDYVDYENGIFKTQYRTRCKVYKRLLLDVPRKPKSVNTFDMEFVEKFLGNMK